MAFYVPIWPFVQVTPGQGDSDLRKLFLRLVGVTGVSGAISGEQLPGSVEKPEFSVVGVAGFEPATPSSRTRCATGLRHTPMSLKHFGEGLMEGRPEGGFIAV